MLQKNIVLCYNINMKRTDEHQKYIMGALEERDIHTIRSIGQALKISAPTGLKRDNLLSQIRHALKEGTLQKSDKRIGRPPKGGEGNGLLKRLDEEYYTSRQAPFRSLAGAQKVYELPTAKLSSKQFDKPWADKIMRGQRVLLYSISPQSIKTSINMLSKHIIKNDSIHSKTIICDVAPELTATYIDEFAGEILMTNFGMPVEAQSSKITGELKVFIENSGHMALMIDDISRFANICAGGALEFEDSVRILCGLAANAGNNYSLTLICGTDDDDFVRTFSRMFNHVNRI